MTFKSRTISVQIDRAPKEVYDFVSDPQNLPEWAKAFCKSIRKSNSDWIMETPQGPMNIRFVPRNTLGVLDHYVMMASGTEVYVPMRVVPNGSGSEILFTIFRLPGMTDKEFSEDAALVEKDLEGLKNVLERDVQGDIR